MVCLVDYYFNFENIDKLVQQPTGCGEQTMITTVPNIYAMQYLTAINDVSPDFREKATKYMKDGMSCRLLS